MRTTRTWAGGLGLALLAGCTSPETSAWNLRQVHDPDGSASYSGDLRTEFEERLLGSGGATVIGGQRLPSVASLFGIEDRREERVEPIEDPYGVALESAVELASFDPAGDPEVRALQVETFGWLAGASAFPLVRERAALELGRLGRLLDVQEPRALGPEVEPLGPDELGERLRALVTAARGGGDVDAAVAALEDAPLDVQGLRYAVRTLTLLRFGGLAGDARVAVFGGTPDARLGALHDALQRRLVAQALATALDDPFPWVRAAAVEAAVVASDNRLAGLLQGAILRGGDEAVVVRGLQLLEKHGIPRWDGAGSAEEEAQYRRSWLGLCVGMLRNAYEGQIAISAAQALARLAPEGPDTLRPEDWIRWFDASIDWSTTDS